MIEAHLWLDGIRAVEQITWAPGLPMTIRDKYVLDGGWVERPNASCFNFYRPPVVISGDASNVDPWLDHLLYIYPDDPDHIIRWLSRRVQRPEEKINHALMLGGSQGIGKILSLSPPGMVLARGTSRKHHPSRSWADLTLMSNPLFYASTRHAISASLTDLRFTTIPKHILPPRQIRCWWTKNIYVNTIFQMHVASLSPRIIRQMVYSYLRRTAGIMCCDPSGRWKTRDIKVIIQETLEVEH